MHLLYIGLPALLGLGTLAALSIIYRRIHSRGTQLKWSFQLAWLQFGLALVSVLLTYSYSISAQACGLAIMGTYGSMAFVVADSVNLMIWFAKTQRAQDGTGVALVLSYIFVRLLVHMALIASFYWCALLCTV